MTVYALKQNLKVGYRVQLKPGPTKAQQYLVGRQATITRIEEMPDSQLIDFQTNEDWQDFLHYRQIHFWVKVDDLNELPDYYRDHEVLFSEDEVRPIPPRMTEQQLLQFCEQRWHKYQDPQQRREAYFNIFMALRWERSTFPYITVEMSRPHRPIDLVNRFMVWAAEMRKSAQEMREQGAENKSIEAQETHAEVCEEIYQRLLPEWRAPADSSLHRRALRR